MIGFAFVAVPLAQSPLGDSSRPLVAASVAQNDSQATTDARSSSTEDSVRSRGGRAQEISAAEAAASTPAQSTKPATQSPSGSTAQSAAPQPAQAPQSTGTAQPATAPQPAAQTQAPSPSAATATVPPLPASVASALSKVTPTQRVGIQAGHWKANEQAAELASLRTSTGAEGKGWREVDINLDIAKRVVAILEKQQNLFVDLLPSTIPPQYKADAFVALHGDANSNTSLSGYKMARSSRSTIPAKDDALLKDISGEYAAATGLHNDPGTITVNMTAYYAFANRGIQHSIASTTPGAILEMGFLTTTKDLNLLRGQPDVVASGIAKGILKFLGR